MENLMVLKREKITLNSHNEDEKCISNISFNTELSTTSIIYGPNKTSTSILIQEITNNGEVSTIAKKEALWSLSELSEVEISDFQFLLETQIYCLIMKNGDIVLIQRDCSSEEERFEIVGSVENGIVAAKWAPDETVLAICTGEEKLLLMSKNFEMISEIPLLESDINITNNVSVGWGKSETQFQGKRSKTTPCDPTIPKKVDKGLLSSFDDQLTRISWRDDGAFLALSKIDAGCRRVIRVFSRNGTLESVSHPVDYLESHLSWKPSGSVIASIQRKPEELFVVFFEKNGYRHGEFSLKSLSPNKDIILDIQWNFDSTLLAILLSNKIQLWHMNNYHWYLNYEIKFQSNMNAFIKWHSEIPLMLALVNKDDLSLYYFIWTITSPPLSLLHDYGTVAVINGDNLQLTPFKIANVPPPLSFRDIKLSKVPTSLSISSDSNYILSLADNILEIIHWPLNTDFSAFPEIVNKLDLTEFLNTYYSRQILYLQENMFAILLDTYDVSKIFFFLFNPPKELELFNNISFETKIALISSGSNEKSVIVESIKGDVFNLSLKEDCKIDKIFLFSLPLLCCYMRSTLYPENKIIFFMSENGKLFANDHLISTNCTSFISSEEYLIFTTSHLVKFVKVMPKIEDFIVPSDDITNINVRCIEKGAKIISVVPSSTALIFQMPRGNIEVIYPRVLVLSEVYKSIKLKKYDKAFLLCRTHRIDTNILYDYDPSQFLDNVSLFVTQLNNSEYLNLFLSTLKEENLAKTLYNLESKIKNDIESEKKISSVESVKVNTICDCILKVLTTYSDKEYVESILTAHLTKIPTDYVSALKLIIDLKNTSLNTAQKAIKYICILADALMHLIEMDNDVVFDEISDYVVLHSLYREAMKGFKNNSVNYNKILELYAIYHEKNNNFEESALAYEILNNYEYATTMYKKAGLWRKALTNAMKSKISDNDISKLAESLSFIMQDKKKFCDAAYIEIYYLKNLKEGLRLLCKGFDYNKAYELVQYYNSSELIQDIIIPGLIDGFTELTELFFDLSSQLNVQIERIRVLRKKKEQDPQTYFEPENYEDIPDNASLSSTDTFTSASIFTQYSTYTTSDTFYKKNDKVSRRKERKKARKQKGSIWEEEYLLNSISRLISRLEDAREDAEKTIQGLLLERLNEKAILLQKQMIRLVEDAKKCSEEVFSCTIENFSENIRNNIKIPPVVRPVNELKILV
ncbi:hypothetical protein PCK1_001947 [Pneumocystis canis]|nr:hypothetical protein PCK1_001947 [Pneumocystis canis]